MREHLLLGSEEYGTLYTACGRKPEKMHWGYALGASQAVRETEYVRLRGIAMMNPCGRCEAAWRKICRNRNRIWTPAARSTEGK